ncbi:MAG: 16S rRNA (guanine(527)-N(7))-methyltransferase RsmG [Armatimonadetes bacterium]|nr:16S rRNA (guanine(527)-N(7))-methyltransferase RsmG [Armatimonadota bacterium]
MHIKSIKKEKYALQKILNEGLKEINLSLLSQSEENFFKFLALILRENQKYNLTSYKSPSEIMINLFLDSLLLLKIPLFKENLKILDLGTGAGIPGIPLKIAKPGLKMHLLESNQKKQRFLELVLKELNLDGEILKGRAEYFAHQENYREKFSIVVSRAVAPLNILLEYALPFLEIKGVLAACKGSQIFQEIENSQNALKILGGELVEVIETLPPFKKIKRFIVIVRKKYSSGEKYPRKEGKALKYPF